VGKIVDLQRISFAFTIKISAAKRLSRATHAEIYFGPLQMRNKFRVTGEAE